MLIDVMFSRTVNSIVLHQLKYQQTKATIGHQDEPVYASTRVKYIFVCDSFEYLRHKLYFCYTPFFQLESMPYSNLHVNIVS
jgi:hypothetical protein